MTKTIKMSKMKKMMKSSFKTKMSKQHHLLALADLKRLDNWGVGVP